MAAIRPVYTVWQLIFYFLKLGTVGFGGPIALIGYMQRDLVETRGWIQDRDYREGVTLAQLAPGPLAAQTAIYLGYVHYGILGASLAGLAFVLPSFLMVVALGFLYKLYGGLAWMQAVFYGVSASVIGIIGVTAYRLTKRTIAKDRLLWVIYVVTALFTVLTESEQVLLFILGGIVTWIIKVPPKVPWRKTGSTVVLAALPVVSLGSFFFPHYPLQGIMKIFLFFTKAGAFVFGSGLAIVPFLYSGVVKEFQWLNDKQFIDAVAVAMITPGPVVITAGFIGFLVAGLPGSAAAALGTFLPCYLFTIIPAPYFRKYGKRPAIGAFIDGVTAAAIGAITGAAIILGRKSINGFLAAAIAVATIILLIRFKKIPEPLIVLAAALIGLAINLQR